MAMRYLKVFKMSKIFMENVGSGRPLLILHEHILLVLQWNTFLLQVSELVIFFFVFFLLLMLQIFSFFLPLMIIGLFLVKHKNWLLLLSGISIKNWFLYWKYEVYIQKQFVYILSDLGQPASMNIWENQLILLYLQLNCS